MASFTHSLLVLLVVLCSAVFVDVLSSSPPSVLKVVLQPQNVDVLRSLIRNVSDPRHPHYQHFLSSDELHDHFAPTAQHVQAVQAWLGVNASQITEYHGRRWILQVHAPWPLSASEIPASLRKIVHRVYNSSGSVGSGSGTTGRRAAAPRAADAFIASPQTVVPVGPFVIAQTLAQYYNAPDPLAYTVLNNHRQLSIAVVASDNINYNATDLAIWAALMGAKKPLIVNRVNSDPAGGFSLEAMVDIELIAVQSPQGTNLTWFRAVNVTGPDKYNLWCQEMLSTMNPLPLVVSDSFGTGEQLEGTDQDATESCLMLLGVGGTTVVAATGDSGAAGFNPTGCNVDGDGTFWMSYPAVSPWVTAVGGTDFTATSSSTAAYADVPFCSNSATIGSLMATYGFSSSNYGHAVPSVDDSFSCVTAASPESPLSSGACTGGGFAYAVPAGYYQATATQAYLSRTDIPFPPQSYGWSPSNRGIPDVVLYGAGASVLIYDQSGVPGIVGSGHPGTSLSAPRFGALMLYLIDKSLQLTGQPLGFINPLLYQMQADNAALFNDITTGNNNCTQGGAPCPSGGWTAAPGWDAVTGLGSPNIGSMVTYLQNKYANSVTPTFALPLSTGWNNLVTRTNITVSPGYGAVAFVTTPARGNALFLNYSYELAGVTLGASYSICVWVSLSSIRTDGYPTTLFGAGPTTSAAYSHGLDGHNQWLYAGRGDWGNSITHYFQTTYKPPQGIQLGVWTHFCATYNASTGAATLYLNGTSVVSNTVAAAGWTGSNLQMYIGGLVDVSWPATGQLQCMGVWNTSISPQQVARIHQRQQLAVPLSVTSPVSPCAALISFL